MKKYTNKILIIAAAVFLAAFTILFFIKATEIRNEIRKNNSTTLTINH